MYGLPSRDSEHPDSLEPLAKAGTESEFVRKGLPAPGVGGRVVDSAEAQNLTLAVLVEELRELRNSREKPKPWWESGLVLALIPTLVAAAIATGWAAVSHHTDMKIADIRRDYDQKATLKNLLDTSFERQASALETVCDRGAAANFQQLKRKWILEPERSGLRNRARHAVVDVQALEDLDEDIAQATAMEAKESATLESEYQKTIGERCIRSIAGEFNIVFDSQKTHASAKALIDRWDDLNHETSDSVVEELKDKLRTAAHKLNEKATQVSLEGRVINLAQDGKEFFAIQSARRNVCKVKADALSKAYEQLSIDSASELSRVRVLDGQGS
jgi:hypothetical protein